MKKLITILGLLFILSINAQSKDNVRYAQFKYDFMNIEIGFSPQIHTNTFQWKPTLIFAATFALIEIITICDRKNNYQIVPWKTLPIFVAGATACFLTYKF